MPRLFVDVTRYTDAARLGKRLDTRRDIDRLPIKVAAAGFDIAEVNTDTNKDLPLHVLRGVAAMQCFLNIYRGLNCFESTWELEVKAVAHALDLDATVRGKDGPEDA